jgi:hypothetical protein
MIKPSIAIAMMAAGQTSDSRIWQIIFGAKGITPLSHVTRDMRDNLPLIYLIPK